MFCLIILIGSDYLFPNLDSSTSTTLPGPPLLSMINALHHSFTENTGLYRNCPKLTIYFLRKDVINHNMGKKYKVKTFPDYEKVFCWFSSLEIEEAI